MTTRPILTTPTMPPNSPRTTTGNRDLLNHTPLPSMYRTTTPFNPTTTLRMVLPLMPFHIQRLRSGMARRGLRSVSPCLRRRPYRKHPCPPTSADQNLRPCLHLRVHRRPHHHPHPSAYMLLPLSHSPTRRHGEPQGHPRPLIRLLNPSASRGRKK